MLEEFLFVEKYRPKTIEDTVLPQEIKKTFQDFIKQGNVPNLILAGSAGCGKTTAARAVLEELGCDYIIINGSMNGNIDTLRNDIMQFASSVSLSGGRKYVILDEADYLNPNSTQPALRNFMEQFSKNCGFILTCNFKNKIIEPLQSRCSVIDFAIPKKEFPELAGQILKRTQYILDKESIEYDKKVIVQLIAKFYPDWRRVINELQRYSANGTIDTGILTFINDSSIKTLIKLLKEKEFTGMRKWVAENADMDSASLFRTFYDTAAQYIKPDSIPVLVLLIAKYQYQDSFVADHEINTVAFLTECMVDLDYI